MIENYNLYVSVEKRHIEAGKKAGCFDCPIALAINECLAEDYHSSIARYINLEYSDRNICEYTAVLPKEVFDFILNFDAGKPVKPFVFVLHGVSERLIKF